MRLQLAIMLALAPLTFAVFDGLSIAGLWVNLIAIPLVSFVLVPLVLAGTLAVLVVPALSHLPFGAAAALYDFAVAWPHVGCRQRAWRCGARRRRRGGSRSRRWRGLVLLRRWPWVLRLPAACAALPLLFVPARGPGRARRA